MKYFTVLWCRHEVCELKKTFCRNVFIEKCVFNDDYPIYLKKERTREREREKERERERERERFILALKILPLKKSELLKM